MFTLPLTGVCIVDPKQTNKQYTDILEQFTCTHSLYIACFVDILVLLCSSMSYCYWCLWMPVPQTLWRENSTATEYFVKFIDDFGHAVGFVSKKKKRKTKRKQIRLMFSSSREQAGHQTVQGSSEAESSKHSGREVRNFVSGTEVTPSELRCIEGLPLFPLG